MKQCLVIVVVGTVLLAPSAWPAWEGRIKQGIQSRQQFTDPSQVRPWLDDTVSSATEKADEFGPWTEVETIYDWDVLKGVVWLGLFSRVLEYTGATYRWLGAPILGYANPNHRFEAGRLKTKPSGCGLLLGEESGIGLRYEMRYAHWEDELLYFGIHEPDSFRYHNIRLAGYRRSMTMQNGKLTALLVYDDSSSVHDPSRDDAMPGMYGSMSGDWEFGNAWFVRGETAFNSQSGSGYLGLDMPLTGFWSCQIRFRYQDEGFAPLLGKFARDAEQQTVVLVRMPFHFYSEQWVIAPQFGMKHTLVHDYWTPGIRMDAILWDALSFHAWLTAEQPREGWGDYEHFEYTGAQILWMLTESVYFDALWTKTFNGVLQWKEIQSRAGVVVQW